MTSRMTLFGVGLLLVGCSATLGQLKPRAAFDLQCAESQLKLYQIDNRTYGVLGCGKRATYVDSCAQRLPGTDTNCTWVLNSEPRREQQPAYRPVAASSYAPQSDRRIAAAQHEGSRRLELEVVDSRKQKILRYSSLGSSRVVKDCRELGLTTGAGRLALPATYKAHVRGGSIQEVVESVLSEEAYAAFATATAIDACGHSLTLSPSFLAGVRPPRAAPPPAAPVASSTNPTLRLALPYVTLVLEADPKDAAGPIVLGFVTTVKPAAEPACAIRLLRDAEPVELGTLEHQAAEAAHEYRTKLALAALEQLGAAKRVVGKICEQRFALSDQHIAQLRDFLLRVREERQLAN